MNLNIASVHTIGPKSYGHIGTKPIAQTQTVDFNSPNLEFVDMSKNGAIAQMINSRYLFEMKKEAKRVLVGRKLEAFLKRTFSVEEFEQLPRPAQNLLMFHKEMSGTDIVRFAEYDDQSHEIIFKEFSYERTRFKALFEALGELYDVQMEAGSNNFFSLSPSFEIRKRVEAIFRKIEEKIVFLKQRKKKPKRAKIRARDKRKRESV